MSFMCVTLELLLFALCVDDDDDERMLNSIHKRKSFFLTEVRSSTVSGMRIVRDSDLDKLIFWARFFAR